MKTRSGFILGTIALAVIWFAAAAALNFYNVWLLWRIVFMIVSILALAPVVFLLIEDE